MSDEAIIVLARKIHGEKAERIMRLLTEKIEMPDEDIARELKLDPAEVRRILNELFESRLVKYRRARDEVIGWYKYYWRVTDEPVARILEDRKRLTLNLLEKVLEYERSDEFFVCPKCGKRFSSIEADENGYMCDECGEVLEPYDNTEIIRKLEQAIRKLREYNPEAP